VLLTSKVAWKRRAVLNFLLVLVLWFQDNPGLTRPRTRSYADKVCRNCGEHPKLTKPGVRDEFDFGLTHYAGVVSLDKRLGTVGLC
jgi:hypothetical protein